MLKEFLPWRPLVPAKPIAPVYGLLIPAAAFSKVMAAVKGRPNLFTVAVPVLFAILMLVEPGSGTLWNPFWLISPPKMLLLLAVVGLAFLRKVVMG